MYNKLRNSCASCVIVNHYFLRIFALHNSISVVFQHKVLCTYLYKHSIPLAFLNSYMCVYQLQEKLFHKITYQSAIKT
jgi:hypothetical protein